MEYRSLKNEMGRVGAVPEDKVWRPSDDHAPKVGDYWTHLFTGRVYRWDGECWVATEETVGTDPLGIVNTGNP